jgi:DNA-binding NtrC family response regulator
MKKRVLVADDDSSIRESLKKLLEQTGYEVSLAANGSETLRKLRSEPTDLLLLDLEMPRRDGWDVLEEVGNQNTSVPILLITGRGDDLHTKRIPGSCGLLEKPVKAELLLEWIAQLVKTEDGVELKEVRAETQETSRSRATDVARR